MQRPLLVHGSCRLSTFDLAGNPPTIAQWKKSALFYRPPKSVKRRVARRLAVELHLALKEFPLLRNQVTNPAAGNSTWGSPTHSWLCFGGPWREMLGWKRRWQNGAINGCFSRLLLSTGHAAWEFHFGRHIMVAKGQQYDLMKGVIGSVPSEPRGRGIYPYLEKESSKKNLILILLNLLSCALLALLYNHNMPYGKCWTGWLGVVVE